MMRKMRKKSKFLFPTDTILILDFWSKTENFVFQNKAGKFMKSEKSTVVRHSFPDFSKCFSVTSSFFEQMFLRKCCNRASLATMQWPKILSKWPVPKHIETSYHGKLFWILITLGMFWAIPCYNHINIYELISVCP